MKNYSFKHAVVGIMVLLLVVLGAAAALAQGGETIVVTSPAEGETVSDIVVVTGAVDFPDFLKYEVFLKAGDNSLHGATGFSPVINGNLAQLDTKTYPDGSYQLIVRAVGTDSNYTDFPGPVFTIQNDLGAPLAHGEVFQSYLYPPQSGMALLRIQNCGGYNMEFDYTSPEGFCSHGNYWIMGKPQDATLCTHEDILVAPCEYRGTAWPEDGQGRALTYSFIAEAGKVYDINYPGGGKLWINETPGDERAPTDTGGLDPMDPERFQSVEEIEGGAGEAEAMMEASGEAVSATKVEATQVETTEAVETEKGEAVVTTEKTVVTAETTEVILPESGQAASPSRLPFAVAGGALILFMVVGGVVAMQRGKQSA